MCLGINENMPYDNTRNKEHVTKEYYNRIAKIWTSGLTAFNKTVTHGHNVQC